MIGRQHPVFGFIYLDALDYNKVYSRLLTIRDNDLKMELMNQDFQLVLKIGLKNI